MTLVELSSPVCRGVATLSGVKHTVAQPFPSVIAALGLKWQSHEAAKRPALVNVSMNGGEGLSVQGLNGLNRFGSSAP
jgi:hypothetical protein